ncbi:MAG: tetratricopeptide repeat protein [candidate division WOR-3 bacterium]|nr:tetratricopeptide repeat protein [candidate division WOR-3 bacterium]
MKCPFLIKRRDVYDDSGKKVDEEVELLACLKNECMVYDSATKLCSLLSSNMKTGVLIDDYKKGVKELRDEMSRGTDALGEGVSAAGVKLQDEIASRLDVQKKQIEVMILGFDKLQEAFSTKFEELNGGLQNFGSTVADKITALGEVLEKQADGLKATVLSLQEKVAEFSASNMRVSDTLLTGINGVGGRIGEELSGLKTQNAEMIDAAVKGLVAKFEDLYRVLSSMSESTGTQSQSLIDRITSIDEVMKTVVNELRFDISSTADRFRDEMSGYLDGVKSEIVNMKTGQAASLDSIRGDFTDVRDLFTKAASNLESMTAMMDNLNNNYLQSLGKIAALAEGMRTGVAEVGESMAQSMKGVTSEASDRLSAVGKQYEKTFDAVEKFAEKFEDLNNRVIEMTSLITREFTESLDRQTKLSEYTKDILENIQSFLQKEADRFEKEQELSRKKTALDHFDRATLYFYRGNYELALNEIDRALEIDNTAEYFNLKGLILAELGKYEDSKDAYLHAIELEPEFSELHNNLGLLYLRMKNVNEAVLSFEESVKKNVNNAMAYVNLGRALIELEKFEEALKAYNKALQIDPSNQEAREAVKLYKEGKIEA